MDVYPAKLTSRGRITIPLTLRRKLKIRPGDRIGWEIAGKEVKIQVLRQSLVQRLRIQTFL